MEERERKSEKTDSKKEVAVPGSSATSVPEPGAESLSEAAQDDADKTNVCSAKFDPLLALYTPTVPLPFPGIKCFNNVAEYESFLKGGRGRGKPENVEKKRRKAMKGAADPERIERLKRLMVNNPVTQPEEGESSTGGSAQRRRKQKPQKNVLTRMPLTKGSPLGELYRCVEERIRVRVYIRTFKGLRGVCSGFVVAFDKFWNMAMVDVDETYKDPVFGEEFYHEKALTVTRLFEKLKLQESEGGEEAGEKQDTPETAGEHPADPKAPAGSSSVRQPADARKDGEAPACRQSDQAAGKKGPAKSGERRQKKSYGRVHTRHVNQLFIRGESVILVNPQPL